MKNIISYKHFIFEKVNSRHVVYHNSGMPIGTITNRPLWASLNIEDALGFYDNMIMDTGESFLYRLEVQGNFPYLYDIENELTSRGIDVEDLIYEIISNPTETELMNLEGVRLLISLGYDGLIYPDYYSWDPSEDTDVILIFKPQNSLVSFNSIVEADNLLKSYKKNNTN